MELAARYASPFKQDDRRSLERNVYDSTAREAVVRFARRFHGAITPPEFQFSRLVPGPLVPDEMKQGVGLILDIVNDRLYSLLKRTNFHSAIGDAYKDYALGEMCLLIQDDDDEAPCTFTALNPIFLDIDEGASGRIESVWYQVQMTEDQLKERYPGINIPEEAQAKMTGQAAQDIPILVYIGKDEQGWHTRLYHYNSSKMMIEYITQSTPAPVNRFDKISGDASGFGPLMVSLPDISTLNHIIEQSLMNNTLELANPMTVQDDGVTDINNVVLKPGIVIPVAHNGGPWGRSIDVLPRNAKFEMSLFNVERLQSTILRQMYADVDQPLDRTQPSSAAEVVHRQQKLTTDLGPQFAASQVFLTEVLNRVLEIFSNKGLIPPLVVDGKQIDISFESPIADAHAVDKLDNLSEGVARIDQILQSGAIDAMDPAAAVEYISRTLKLPAKLFPYTREQIEQKRAERLEAMANAGGQSAPQGGPQ